MRENKGVRETIRETKRQRRKGVHLKRKTEREGEKILREIGKDVKLPQARMSLYLGMRE